MIEVRVSSNGNSETLLCDAYACDTVSYSQRTLYAISATGSQSQIIAARAMFNSRNGASVHVDGVYMSCEKYDIRISKLQKYRQANMVLRARNDRLCMGEKYESVGAYLLSDAIDSPILESWIPWVIGKLSVDGKIKQLDCYGGIEAYLCKFSSVYVDSVVAHGIKFGHLRIEAPKLAPVGA